MNCARVRESEAEVIFHSFQFPDFPEVENQEVRR